MIQKGRKWSKPMSIEGRKNISLSFNPERRKQFSERMKGKQYKLGKKLSEETKEKMSLSKIKHYNKIGRKKNKRYYHKKDRKYRKWRSDVFTRDNWTCQTCGIRSSVGIKVLLEPHHIKSWARFPKSRYILGNGITLCKECHKLTDNFGGNSLSK